MYDTDRLKCGSQSFGVVVVDGLSVGVSLDAGGGKSVLPVLDGPDLDDPGVDGASDAVGHLDVELGDDVVLEGLVLLEVLLGGSIHDVSDIKSLDGLVLGAQLPAVHTYDRLDVTSVVLVTAVVSSLDGHLVVIRVNIIKNKIINKSERPNLGGIGKQIS